MDILKKNLLHIEKFNEPLCQKLLALGNLTKNFEINTNLAGEYNLLIDGKPVHSITDIAAENKAIRDVLPHDLKASLHFVYGVGLGYLPDYFVENTKGFVIVYEPDIEVLYFVLSAVDFSDSFQKNRLYFVSDYSEVLTLLPAIFRYKSMASLSTLDYYKLYHRKDFDAFKSFIIRRVEIANHNISFQAKKNYSFFEKTLMNLYKKFAHPFVADYKDALKNKPALIVSAGPSLAQNIDVIREHQDKFLIFCVGTAYRTLVENGVNPDFLHVIERTNTFVHYDLPNTKDVNLIVEPYTESSYFKKDFKHILYTTALESDDARWFLEKNNKSLIPFETKGTVAYHAIYTAYYFGCNPIILVGQDLAYTGGDCYAKGSCFDGLACVFDETTSSYKVVFKDKDKFKEAYYRDFPDCPDERKEQTINARLQELNTNLQTVKGQNGKMLPTDAVYALFLDYIQDFASIYSQERNLINSSVGGADISGFTNMSLTDAITKYSLPSLNKVKLVDSVDFKSNVDGSVFIKNLKDDLKNLKPMTNKLHKGLDLSINLSKIVYSESQISYKSADLSKKLSSIYAEIVNGYLLNNRFCKMVLFKEFLELDYLFREYGRVDSLDIAKEFCSAYEEFFCTGYKKASRVLEVLEYHISELEKLYESCFAKG